ncbi:aminotransferase class III-fold pyridoxal phosphate-dependent enzyme [Stieleria marina]
MIDALAGRASAIGFGNSAIAEAILSASEDYLGDANQFDLKGVTEYSELTDKLSTALQVEKHLAVETLVLCDSADAATETAIAYARTWKPDSFRTVALIGSDHGRTAACRTASGRPELHEDFGPMMAGFAHVPTGDIDALRATVDDQTACVLISPIDLHDAARQLDVGYLNAVREVCDQHQVALIIDESKLCVGSSGAAFHFAAIADIQVDGLILSAGLFGGLPGGIFLGSKQLVAHHEPAAIQLPLQNAVATAIVSEMNELNFPSAVVEPAQQLAVMLAERVGGFEFIRDLHATGMTIGIETDISADEIVAAAVKEGLRIETSGETAIRMQLPLVCSDEDRDSLVERFGLALEHVEHESVDTAVTP